MFNINDVTEQEEHLASMVGLLPEGDYNFVVQDAFFKDNKKGNGKYIELVCILEGTNRKFWIYFNIIHENKSTQAAGKTELKKFMLAIGKEKFERVEELQNQVFRATIEHEYDKFSEKKKEKIVGFSEYLWTDEALRLKEERESLKNQQIVEHPYSNDDVPF